MKLNRERRRTPIHSRRRCIGCNYFRFFESHPDRVECCVDVIRSDLNRWGRCHIVIVSQAFVPAKRGRGKERKKDSMSSDTGGEKLISSLRFVGVSFSYLTHLNKVRSSIFALKLFDPLVHVFKEMALESHQKDGIAAL